MNSKELRALPETERYSLHTVEGADGQVTSYPVANHFMAHYVDDGEPLYWFEKDVCYTKVMTSSGPRKIRERV